MSLSIVDGRPDDTWTFYEIPQGIESDIIHVFITTLSKAEKRFGTDDLEILEYHGRRIFQPRTTDGNLASYYAIGLRKKAA